MGFFELPDPEPGTDEVEAWVEHGTPPTMPWLGPPRYALPAAVPEPFLLFSSDRLAIAMQDVGVFATGVSFTLVSVLHAAFARTAEAREVIEREFGLPPRFGGGRNDFLRFGVLFSDGGKATNLDDETSFAQLGLDEDADEPVEPPAGPVLNGGTGNHFGSRSEDEYWLWPLPPPGPVTFVCEWPVFQVPETRLEIDAAVFHAAAHSAREIWPE
jgi:hypothetical protein